MLLQDKNKDNTRQELIRQTNVGKQKYTKTKTAQAKSARMYKKQTGKNRNKLSNRQFWHNTAMY